LGYRFLEGNRIDTNHPYIDYTDMFCWRDMLPLARLGRRSRQNNQRKDDGEDHQDDESRSTFAHVTP